MNFFYSKKITKNFSSKHQTSSSDSDSQSDSQSEYDSSDSSNSDSYDSSDDDSQVRRSNETWKDFILRERFHGYLVDIEDSYIEDEFNLKSIPPFSNYKLLKKLLLGSSKETNYLDSLEAADRNKIIDSLSRLYVFIHNRYIITASGLREMTNLINSGKYLTCPLSTCNKNNKLKNNLIPVCDSDLVIYNDSDDEDEEFFINKNYNEIIKSLTKTKVKKNKKKLLYNGGDSSDEELEKVIKVKGVSCTDEKTRNDYLSEFLSEDISEDSDPNSILAICSDKKLCITKEYERFNELKGFCMSCLNTFHYSNFNHKLGSINGIAFSKSFLSLFLMTYSKKKINTESENLKSKYIYKKHKKLLKLSKDERNKYFAMCNEQKLEKLRKINLPYFFGYKVHSSSKLYTNLGIEKIEDKDYY